VWRNSSSANPTTSFRTRRKLTRPPTSACRYVLAEPNDKASIALKQLGTPLCDAQSGAGMKEPVPVGPGPAHPRVPHQAPDEVHAPATPDGGARHRPTRFVLRRWWCRSPGWRPLQARCGTPTRPSGISTKPPPRPRAMRAWSTRRTGGGT
jgi:hypothetical protein